MSLSFACPSCRAFMEVADELAGRSGQCPRCQHVFVVPSPALGLPKPTLAGKAIPATEMIPPTDPWAEEKPKPSPRSGRPRRVHSVPPAPSGPLWPWFIAVPLGLVVAVLLFSSFIVLVSWRKPPTITAGVALPGAAPAQPFHRVTTGRLEGNRAFLQAGVFQVRTELTNNDMRDLDKPICRAKRYDIELIANRTYVIEQDSDQFDSLVRVEDFNGPLNQDGRFGQRNASFRFTPIITQIFMVYATSDAPATGTFTLTVREEFMPKPFVP